MNVIKSIMGYPNDILKLVATYLKYLPLFIESNTRIQKSNKNVSNTLHLFL